MLTGTSTGYKSINKYAQWLVVYTHAYFEGDILFCSAVVWTSNYTFSSSVITLTSISIWGSELLTAISTGNKSLHNYANWLMFQTHSDIEGDILSVVQ